jgi:16S rRNA (cytosine967-C5)-methyltransferase
MGLYQLRFLERIPARAAVHESVELVKRARKASAAPLVNAVLRRLAPDAKAPAEEFLPGGMALAERLAILHSHPVWMVERWLARAGEPRTLALLEANNRTPRLSCALHDVTRSEEILGSLQRTGLRAEPGQLLKTAFAVSGGSPTRTAAFRTGDISVQDEASQAIPLLLDVQRADRVLDLCAAPGGKTPPLARATGKKGLVIAADRHAHRLRAMREQFTRLGLDGAHLVELDATKPLPFRTQFNRILVDAPCSGTGTLARHPEIRWRLQPEQLPEFHKLQTSLLDAALERLALGGRLVYSTCSLELEENETVVSEALDRNHSIRRVSKTEAARSIAPHLVPGAAAASLFDDEGQFRTAPGAFQTDGFFAALLEKK